MDTVSNPFRILEKKRGTGTRATKIGRTLISARVLSLESGDIASRNPMCRSSDADCGPLPVSHMVRRGQQIELRRGVGALQIILRPSSSAMRLVGATEGAIPVFTALLKWGFSTGRMGRCSKTRKFFCMVSWLIHCEHRQLSLGQKMSLAINSLLDLAFTQLIALPEPDVQPINSPKSVYLCGYSPGHEIQRRTHKLDSFCSAGRFLLPAASWEGLKWTKVSS